ncbi:MAG TPA: hybrid sensor histidine kinase/response regulator [Planktothrix sp. UBA8407]|jgi:Response regulators consisting of a CheY-like receiver domain and a winged-helix DNA-binding domain|nr:hybrid sensor histidine kinase/response regulator [Planktothrix sp. UBA8402]HAO13711.1 hybrid sensor histidine kinase/response regulator [Planktothrix sp. UBA8407]HBK23804.1 hybrid sensor histidine kinase/response regulator [Planktothrix sp. UBA10369]
MKKILVIEDDLNVRSIILDILEAEEFLGVSAEDGKTGVKLAKEILPDLIICDVMMPELDGHQVLEELRSYQATATIPFIFLTAKSTTADLRYGMNLGADDYLTKPFSHQDLLAAIRSRIQKHEIFEQQTQAQLNKLCNNITLSLPHELRTPLNGIMGTTQLLISDFQEMSPDEIQEMLENISISAARLYRLTCNFLLYADLELLNRDPQRLKYFPKGSISDPEILIKSVIKNKSQENSQNPHDFCFEIEKLTLNIPEEILIKITEELIDNAIKFSDINAPISVKGHKIMNRYCLEFINSGRGMTAEQIAKIGAYQQFERDIYEQQGSGLGLILVKRLLHFYQGDLEIESTPGKTIIVRIFLSIVPN